eukprot:9105967-Ditylum_brightwellii.AAC.1
MRRILHHKLRYEKGGRPISTPGHSRTGSASKCQKTSGALHPNSLLSLVDPDEEVIAPGVSSTGWVRRPLSKHKMADAFDLPRHVKIEG